MQRRSFLAAAATAGVLPLGGGAAARGGPAGGVLLQRVRLAGAAYSDAPAIAAALEPGEPVELRRAPDDGFDRNAVEVFARGRRLGNVPGVHAPAVARLLEAGFPVGATIAAAALAAPGRPAIDVELRLQATPA